MEEYGYNDKIEEPKEFERQLVENLKELIRQENFILEGGSTKQVRETVNIQHSGLLKNDDKARRSSSSTVHVEGALDNQIPSRILSSSIHSFKDNLQPRSFDAKTNWLDLEYRRNRLLPKAMRS
ncbi:Potassium transporter [Forsythia ovata]|uniref:Potassium transporter n=1 Tax=Forsythia ovata TaxID=205694 RepID=A0ABD1Q0P1_9LAMI